MALHWLATDARTGTVLADFPDLNIGTLQRTIGAYNTTTATFPVAGHPAPPSNWFTATELWKSMMVAVNDDGDPVWGGYVTRRPRKGGAQVELTLSTPEVYTTRRFVRQKLQYPQVDRLFIAADLLNRFVVDGASGRNGIPLRIQILSDGVLTDGDYADTDDRTVYSILQDLGGEWTFSLEWRTNPTRITPVCYLAEQLGLRADPTSGPALTLDWPGNLASASITGDYSESNGGNDVMTSSSGSGEVRPQSDHQVTLQADRPTIELRQAVGSNITSRATLNTAARQILAATADGAVGYALTISQNSPAAFAFDIGDDVGVDLQGPEFPEHPAGTLRVAGIQIDKSTVTPILAGGDLT
jgi:hypothetical protein